MKVKKRALLSYGDVQKFANEHIGETFKIYAVKPTYVDLEQEIEQSVAEIHMESLHTMLQWVDIFNDDEKAAIEYAIECIKTLDDMGIIKENKDND